MYKNCLHEMLRNHEGLVQQYDTANARKRKELRLLHFRPPPLCFLHWIEGDKVNARLHTLTPPPPPSLSFSFFLLDEQREKGGEEEEEKEE